MLAYLDPGSGSMITQAVVAGVAGAVVVAKLSWRRMRSSVHKTNKQQPEPKARPGEDASPLGSRDLPG